MQTKIYEKNKNRVKKNSQWEMQTDLTTIYTHNEWKEKMMNNELEKGIQTLHGNKLELKVALSI